MIPTPAPFTVLHGGYGPDVTLLEYLFRALLHLLGFGGIVVLVLRVMGAVETVRSGFGTEHDGETRER